MLIYDDARAKQSWGRNFRTPCSFDKEEKCLMVPSVNDYDDVEACKNCKSSDKIPQVGIPLDHMQKFGTSLKLGLPFFQNCT